MTPMHSNPTPQIEYLGAITVVILASSEETAESELRELARQLEDLTPAVVFADHNGDVEEYPQLEIDDAPESNTSALLTPFDDYEVHGIRAVEPYYEDFEQVDDSDAQLWSLFGHIPGHGLECIGNFDSRQLAEAVYARITRRHYPQTKEGK
jgi:hypothetical protein